MRRGIDKLLVVAAVCGIVSIMVTGLTSAGLLATRQATHQIQQERARSIREACRAQNARNMVAYLFLKSLPPNPGQPERSPAEQERLLRGFTDALVGPVRSCDVVVRRLAPPKP